MINTPSKQIPTPTRCPACVTEIHVGNTVLTVSSYFKRDTIDIADDKVAKVMKAKSRCQQHPGS